MPLVAAFLQYGRELDPLHGSYYSNMTGYWHGDAALHNLTTLNASEQAAPWRSLSEQFILPTNLTAIADMLGPWNWTRTNKVTLNVGDKLVPFRLESNGTTDSSQEESKGEKKNIAVIHVSNSLPTDRHKHDESPIGQGGAFGPQEPGRTSS